MPLKKGFACMSPEKMKEIARLGGIAAHRKKTAHQWTSEEAREAGRKGGKIIGQRRDHMSAIGKKGGAISTKKASERFQQMVMATTGGAVDENHMDIGANNNL